MLTAAKTSSEKRDCHNKIHINAFSYSHCQSPTIFKHMVGDQISRKKTELLCRTALKSPSSVFIFTQF